LFCFIAKWNIDEVSLFSTPGYLWSLSLLQEASNNQLEKSVEKASEEKLLVKQGIRK